MSSFNAPKIVIATRGSALAMAQARWVEQLCQLRKPSWQFEIRVIRTTGDKLQTVSLANPDKSLPKGLFTKEIEEALLDGSANLAVHSLKDLPTLLPDGLKLGAVPERRDVRDVLITRQPVPEHREDFWKTIPQGCVLASSSLRRKSQIIQCRPDITVEEIRGNVGTRLRKISENHGVFGTVLAAAGMDRLGIRIDQDQKLSGPDVPSGLFGAHFPLEDMLPCVGQAALGIEIRSDDALADELCVAINSAVAWYEAHAERAFLRELGGGCQSPIAALASYRDGMLHLRGMVDMDGRRIRHEVNGSLEEAEGLGEELAGMVHKSLSGT